jgi:hypothetical protein
MQVVLSADAVRLYTEHMTHALLPVLGAAAPAGQGWQAFVREVGAALNVPAGQSMQPACDRRGVMGTRAGSGNSMVREGLKLMQRCVCTAETGPTPRLYAKSLVGSCVLTQKHRQIESGTGKAIQACIHAYMHAYIVDPPLHNISRPSPETPVIGLIPLACCPTRHWQVVALPLMGLPGSGDSVEPSGHL